VGFLGAGIIFVRKDSVRGLTTAAAIWLTASVGACAGAGLPVLAALTTVIYLVVATLFPAITRRLPRSPAAISVIRIRYPDGQGILRQLLVMATDRGFAIDEVVSEHRGPLHDSQSNGASAPPGLIEVTLRVHGRASVNDLAASFSEMSQVETVVAGDANVIDE
jgi:putative Mg2+ transporter-C (MgtC) family protein